MKYVDLGKTGLKVSKICLGTMQFGWSVEKDESMKIMDRAWDLGINFFDTADIYSRWAENSYPGKTEEIIGEWLQRSGVRDDLILATKVRHPMSDKPNDQGLSRRHIRRSIDGSLQRLKTSWVDLYQTHAYDEAVPIETTLSALTELIHEGKVHYIGASNYAAWRIVESIHVAEKYGLEGYQTIQPYYSLVRRHRFEPDLQEVALKYGLGVIPYSPLAGGFLTGKYRRNEPLPQSARATNIQNRFFNDRGFLILETLEEVAKDKGVPIASLALSWVMHQPAITSPITGTTSVQQLEELVSAVEISLSGDELKRLNVVSDPQSNLIIP